MIINYQIIIEDVYGILCSLGGGEFLSALLIIGRIILIFAKPNVLFGYVYKLSL